jgi:23S rRNA (pseudouridine1915-N3)-methyltransferase
VRLRILAVGKLGERYWRDACDEYVKRLGRYAKVEVVEVADRSLASGERVAVQAEGRDLLGSLAPGSLVVALDACGRPFTSEQFAAWLEDKMTHGLSDVTFVLGGSAGLDDPVLERADERLSLSRMTLPHQLCRVVLLEQVYRAFRIIRNEPYHR